MQFNLAQKKDRKKYTDNLKLRLAYATLGAAKVFYKYQVPNVAYEDNSRPAWTLGFRANWNIAIDSPNITLNVYRKEVYPDDTYAGAFSSFVDTQKAEKMYTYAKCQELLECESKCVYVSNSSYYAQWLNDGGPSSEFGIVTFKPVWEKPSHFMEHGTFYVIKRMRDVVLEAIKKTSDFNSSKESKGSDVPF